MTATLREFPLPLRSVRSFMEAAYGASGRAASPTAISGSADQ
jgi:hypothetical protein